MSTQDSVELDLLIADVKRLLGEEPPEDTEEKAAPTRYPWEEPGYTGEYHGPREDAPVVQSHGVKSAPAERQAAAPRAGQPAQAAAARASAAESGTVPPAVSIQAKSAAAKAAARPAGGTAARAKPSENRAVTMAAARSAPKPSARIPDDEYEDPVPKKPRRAWKIILVLVLLGLVAFGVFTLAAKQPVGEDAGLGARKDGVSTLLLAGVDEGGERTDTLMLLTIDKPGRTASLVSIPRDTLVNGSYTVPKINGVYGVNGGGPDGIDMLMQRVGECIGFRPDGYVLVNLESFMGLVDLMGGVDFNVPVDMYYNDPAQDLYIDLKAGQQHLDGEAAMGVVRFRSGYAAADLERVNVQRNFVAAAADQWLALKNLTKVPQLLSWYGENVDSDLSVGNLTWIAAALMNAELLTMETETLPGGATNISGGSYYVLDPYAVAELVNRCCNPYEKEITVDDLSIRS